MIINSGWLSLILFTLSIDDLFDEDSECNSGVKVGGDLLHMLLYADDIVISHSVGMAQKQLDILTMLCANWRMRINVKKSQVMHMRNYQKPTEKTSLSCCGQELSYSETYKYLSYIIQEKMSEKNTVETQVPQHKHESITLGLIYVSDSLQASPCIAGLYSLQ